MKNQFIIRITYGALAANLLWALVCTYLNHRTLSRPSTLLIKGGQPSNLPLANETGIYGRNLFNASGTLADSSDTCGDNMQKSTIPFTVVGIIYGGSDAGSIAVLQNDEDNTSQAYANNTPVQGAIHITGISKDRVFLSVPGASCKTYLEVPPVVSASLADNSLGGPTPSYEETGFERVGNTVAMTKQWLSQTIQTKLPTILAQVKALPYEVDGKIQGFRLSQLQQGSVFEKLGLQNDDIVTAINGVALSDAAQAIATLNSLRTSPSISIDVIRNGVPTTMSVSVQ